MLDFFKSINKFDVLFFLPHPENKENVYIECAEYKRPTKLIDNSDIGPMWHIVLFRCEEDGISEIDHFEGIFSDPREYVSNLIPQDWYGFVAKKTTRSKKFVKESIAKISESFYNKES